jgi:hypothetical protein
VENKYSIRKSLVKGPIVRLELIANEQIYFRDGNAEITFEDCKNVRAVLGCSRDLLESEKPRWLISWPATFKVGTTHQMTQ